MMYGASAMFSIIPILFLFTFFAVIGTLIGRLFKSGTAHCKNSTAPELTVGARICAKRTNLSARGYSTGVNPHCSYPSATSYFVTFEVHSGDRMEFSVSGEEYGMLAEGDTGFLTFRGNIYTGFERNKPLQ